MPPRNYCFPGASPQNGRMNGSDLTFLLGVTLYEMLAGVLPLQIFSSGRRESGGEVGSRSSSCQVNEERWVFFSFFFLLGSPRTN